MNCAVGARSVPVASEINMAFAALGRVAMCDVSGDFGLSGKAIARFSPDVVHRYGHLEGIPVAG